MLHLRCLALILPSHSPVIAKNALLGIGPSKHLIYTVGAPSVFPQKSETSESLHLRALLIARLNLDVLTLSSGSIPPDMSVRLWDVSETTYLRSRRPIGRPSHAGLQEDRIHPLHAPEAQSGKCSPVDGRVIARGMQRGGPQEILTCLRLAGRRIRGHRGVSHKHLNQFCKCLQAGSLNDLRSSGLRLNLSAII